MEAEVFPDLKIADSSFLSTLPGRSQCSKCGKSRKYYCYTCCLPVPGTQDRTPHVKVRNLDISILISSTPYIIKTELELPHFMQVPPENDYL